VVPNSRPLRSQRLIFYGQKWQDIEIQHLKGFAEHMKNKNLSLPDWWPEQETLRCLHASNWDYNKTFTDINIIINWRATNLPIKLEDVHARLLRSGFFTVHGRDKFLRPVMIMRPLVLLREGLADANLLLPVACY
jgi:hypothetical protein